MFRRQPPPFAERVAAHHPITGELLAAIAGAPVDLADRFAMLWFAAVQEHCERGCVLVFDEFVVGPPGPLLLEAAHHVRLVRRAEALGLFDDEEADWYEEHADDDSARWESPLIPDRVLVALGTGQHSDQLASGEVVTAQVARQFGPCSPTLWIEIRVMWALEHVVVSLADAIRVGDAAVVDARLPGERLSERWAA
ncbi:MAG: hypothetical protein WKF60_13620 [Ilumatobacter sp.]